MATLGVKFSGFYFSDLLGDAADATLTTMTATSFGYTYPGSATGFSLTGSGSGLTYSAGKLTGGTITSFTYTGFGGLGLWTITGVSMSASAFQAAVDSFETTGSTAAFLNLWKSQSGWNVTGGRLDEDFFGSSGVDVLNGGLGDDSFVGYKGNDRFIGGPLTGSLLSEEDSGRDYDTVSYRGDGGTLGIVVDMRLASAQVTDTWGNKDTLIGIEQIRGTALADNFRGSDGAQYEAFSGEAGNDIINGGLGLYDEVRYDRETGTLGVNVNLATGVAKDTFGNTDTLSGIEFVRGSSRADTLTGDAANNRFRGFAGADTINGGLGVDTVQYHQDAERTDPTGIYGTKGVRVDLQSGIARDGFNTFDRLISIENARGSNSHDRIAGSTANNKLEGWGGSDFLDGRAGNDALYGNDGDDHIVGGLGDDIISGGNGADLLVGDAGSDTILTGAGTDVVLFNSLTGADTVQDFDVALDDILIDNSVFTALTTAGALSSAAFKLGTAATTTAQKIIYDGATGKLYYDADGSGAGAKVLVATFTTKPALTFADFDVI